MGISTVILYRIKLCLSIVKIVLSFFKIQIAYKDRSKDNDKREQIIQSEYVFTEQDPREDDRKKRLGEFDYRELG